ncbi:MAG: hypothetical protein ACTSRW_02640 [Candidatus Helarchaeota archaeon]
MGIGKVIAGMALAIFGWIFIFLGIPGNAYKYLFPFLELISAAIVDITTLSYIAQIGLIFTYNINGFINFPFIFGIIVTIIGFVFMIYGAIKRSYESNSSYSWSPSY